MKNENTKLFLFVLVFGIVLSVLPIYKTGQKIRANVPLPHAGEHLITFISDRVKDISNNGYQLNKIKIIFI